MPIWTLRLIACAGFVALLSRLPALDTTADALALGAGVGALALVAHIGPPTMRALRERFTRRRVSPSAL